MTDVVLTPKCVNFDAIVPTNSGRHFACTVAHLTCQIMDNDQENKKR